MCSILPFMGVGAALMGKARREQFLGCGWLGGWGGWLGGWGGWGGWVVAWLLGCLVAWLLGCLFVWFLGCFVVWLLGYLAA